MALDYPALLDELRVETEGLTTVLDRLRPAQWKADTPAAGWTVRDQVSHLAYFDGAAVDAIRSPRRFKAEAAEWMAAGMDFPARIAERYRDMAPGDLCTWFVRARRDLLAVLTDTEPRTRIPWYGPDMSVASSATARLMETWAHGQDIYDALQLPHPPSAGLKSIAHLGISTFGFVHTLHDREVPDEPVRVELLAPDARTVWAWGPESCDNVVSGPAEDFVLAVTQRRHITDTALTVTGAVAEAWMSIAQAFAGAPGSGRAPLTAASSHGRIP